MSTTDTATNRVLTVPNAISFARLLLVPAFAVLIVQHQDLWALAVLAVSSFSDWLDGVIARKFDQGSRLGQLLDPAADRLYIAVTLLGLAWRELIPWWLVAVIVGREIVLGVALLVIRHYGYPPPQVHFAGKAGTFALLYAFPLILLGAIGGVVGQIAWTFGWAFAIWGVGLYLFSGVLYLWQDIALVRHARSA